MTIPNFTNGKPAAPQPQISRLFFHVEAFAMMQYECSNGHRITIWNSRDGVTPYGALCPVCSSATTTHIDFAGDRFAPGHQLRPGEYYWRDGTLDELRDAMRRRVEENPPSPEYLARLGIASPEAFAEQLAEAQHTQYPHWPKLDRISIYQIATPRSAIE